MKKRTFWKKVYERYLLKRKSKLAINFYAAFMEAKKIQNPEGYKFIWNSFAHGAQTAATQFAADLLAWFSEGEQVEERFYYMSICMDRKFRVSQVSLPPKQWTRVGFEKFIHDSLTNLHDGFFLTPEEEQALLASKMVGGPKA